MVDPYGILEFNKAYTITHEISHALELSHPRNDHSGYYHQYIFSMPSVSCKGKARKNPKTDLQAKDGP